MLELLFSFMLFTNPHHNHSPPYQNSYYNQQEPLRISHREVLCLEANTWHEARGEGLVGMMAVAKTTLNRAKHDGWPPDVCKVVYQSKQFSWTSKPKKKQIIRLKNSIDQQSYSLVKLASQLAIKADQIGLDYMQGATYYHTLSVNPSWSNKLETVVVINNHIFKKDKT